MNCVSHFWFAWQTAQQIQPWYIKKIWANWFSGKSKMTSKLLIVSRIRYNRDVNIFLICFRGYSWCAYKNFFRHISRMLVMLEKISCENIEKIFLNPLCMPWLLSMNEPRDSYSDFKWSPTLPTSNIYIVVSGMWPYVLAAQWYENLSKGAQK